MSRRYGCTVFRNNTGSDPGLKMEAIGWVPYERNVTFSSLPPVMHFVCFCIQPHLNGKISLYCTVRWRSVCVEPTDTLKAGKSDQSRLMSLLILISWLPISGFTCIKKKIISGHSVLATYLFMLYMFMFRGSKGVHPYWQVFYFNLFKLDEYKTQAAWCQ